MHTQTHTHSNFHQQGIMPSTWSFLGWTTRLNTSTSLRKWSYGSIDCLQKIYMMCKNLFLMEITLDNGHWMDPARGHPSLSWVHPMANIWYIYIHTHILHNHPYIFARTSFSMTHTLTHTHPSQSHTHISFTIISSTPKFNYSILNPPPSNSSILLPPSTITQKWKSTHRYKTKQSKHTYPSQPSALHPISTTWYSTPIHQTLRYHSLIAHYSNRKSTHRY